MNRARETVILVHVNIPQSREEEMSGKQKKKEKRKEGQINKVQKRPSVIQRGGRPASTLVWIENVE